MIAKKLAHSRGEMAFDNRSVIFAGLLLLCLSLATCLGDETGNVLTSTEVPCNQTECGATVTSEGSGNTELMVCLGIAAVVTVIACIGFLVIKKVGKSSGYASGGNIPKPLAGLSDDF